MPDIAELGLLVKDGKIVGTVRPWAHTLHIIQYRIDKGETPTQAEILAALAAHPDVGPAITKLLTKGKRKRGPRANPDAKWARHLSRVWAVSLREAELRRQGERCAASRARREVAQELGIALITLEDVVRRAPLGAPAGICIMHQALRDYGRAAGLPSRAPRRRAGSHRPAKGGK